jgi:hypothetical protein
MWSVCGLSAADHQAPGQSKAIDRLRRGEDGRVRIGHLSEVPVAADQRADPGCPGGPPAPGDLGDEGVCFHDGGVAAELGALEDSSQLGWKAPADEGLDPMVENDPLHLDLLGPRNP